MEKYKQKAKINCAGAIFRAAEMIEERENENKI
jgi:hypothetical protein